MRVISVFFLAAAGLLPAAAATAQGYPLKPVRVVVPFAAGGGVDITARIVMQRLTEQGGYTVVIDNRPGANGNLGADMVAKAAPDGYTLLMSAVTLQAINAALYPKLPYDLGRDFTPVILLAQAPLFLITHPSLPAKSVREFIALAKARPGQLNYGSSGTGSSLHLAGVMFDRATGIRTNHVPYKGGGPASIDLAAGQIEFGFLVWGIVQQFVETGRLRNLGVAARERFPDLPKIPTIIEQGVPDFEADSWYGLMAPANLPKDVLDKLHADVAKVMAGAEVRRKLSEQGMAAHASSADQFARYLRNDIAKYAKVVRESGIKVDF